MQIGRAHAAVLRRHALAGMHAEPAMSHGRMRIYIFALAAQAPGGLTIVGARKRASCERVVFPVHMFFRLWGRGRCGRQFEVVD